MAHRLLREFIRENLGAMFGLDRHVSMNALADTISGPHPIDKLVQDDPVTSYALARASEPDLPSAVDYLGPLEQQDDEEDPIDLDQ